MSPVASKNLGQRQSRWSEIEDRHETSCIPVYGSRWRSARALGFQGGRVPRHEHGDGIGLRRRRPESECPYADTGNDKHSDSGPDDHGPSVSSRSAADPTGPPRLDFQLAKTGDLQSEKRVRSRAGAQDRGLVRRQLPVDERIQLVPLASVRVCHRCAWIS